MYGKYYFASDYLANCSIGGTTCIVTSKTDCVICIEMAYPFETGNCDDKFYSIIFTIHLITISM